MHDGLQDVLFWDNAFHVLDKLEGLLNIIILQVVNYKIKSSFWDHIDKRR